MKVLYSSIKQFVPTLTATAREVADVLALIGFMADQYEEVTHNSKPDVCIGLEVRQNRADCFSVMGIAREVAAYYGLSVEFPPYTLTNEGTSSLDIEVKTSDSTARVLAIQLDGVVQQESPAWLKEFLELHGMNTINIMVDISNYVMIMTGYPSHCIDATAIEGTLMWKKNTHFENIETLDGSVYPLSKDGRYLLIHDNTAPVALAGIVGSRYGAISPATSSVIVELAVYDSAVVRDNMRSLHIYTEAGNRLGKDLDPDGAYYAFSMMISLLQEHTHGTIVSSLFEYYPKEPVQQTVDFDPMLPSRIAGIDIPVDTVKTILGNLFFEVHEQGNMLQARVPLFRTDIAGAEDIAEEVIRIVGFDKIPGDVLPDLAVVPDITPISLQWADVIHDILVNRGYDEIRSLPLVSSEVNASVRYSVGRAIMTQNAVNEEYPELRQSLLAGMLMQKEQYQKRNVSPMYIFEYGKAFDTQEGKYEEHEMLALAVISADDKKSIVSLYYDIGYLFARMGLDLTIRKSVTVPSCANPYSCWDLMVTDTMVGICCILDDTDYPDGAVAELNIDKLLQSLHPISKVSTGELTEKLVSLDTNVVCSGDEELFTHINELYATLGDQAWSIMAVDRYPLESGTRYTLRVTYRDLSDTDAKALHMKTFELNT